MKMNKRCLRKVTIITFVKSPLNLPFLEFTKKWLGSKFATVKIIMKLRR